jgi:hypothetical protein
MGFLLKDMKACPTHSLRQLRDQRRSPLMHIITNNVVSENIHISIAECGRSIQATCASLVCGAISGKRLAELVVGTFVPLHTPQLLRTFSNLRTLTTLLQVKTHGFWPLHVVLDSFCWLLPLILKLHGDASI